MIKFFYDSLETLQKVTFPTKKDYINLTIGIFVIVIVSGFFFVVVDTILSGAYRTFYTVMRPDGQSQLEQQRMLSWADADISNNVVVDAVSGENISGLIVTPTDETK